MEFIMKIYTIGCIVLTSAIISGCTVYETPARYPVYGSSYNAYPYVAPVYWGSNNYYYGGRSWYRHGGGGGHGNGHGNGHGHHGRR